jgi:hypothetical protein
MYTMMALVALTMGTTAGKLSPQPAWIDDYGRAQKRVTEVKKPMAVFIGSGKDGWEKVVKDGLDAEVKAVLAQKFVCVYANTETAEGKALARAFEVGKKGLVISDRTGSTQAYSLSGTLTRAELNKKLAKYGDNRTDVHATETVVRDGSPPAPVRPASYQPTYRPQYQVVPSFRPGGT